LTLTSDGAFKIFVYICLRADRRSAQFRFRMAELARATGHSVRSLTSYLEELRRTEVVLVYRAANQHELGRIEIRDRFWPYVKAPDANSGEDPEQKLGSAAGFWNRHACARPSRQRMRNWLRNGIAAACRWSASSAPS